MCNIALRNQGFFYAVTGKNQCTENRATPTTDRDAAGIQIKYKVLTFMPI